MVPKYSYPQDWLLFYARNMDVGIFWGNLLAPDYRCLFSELSYELQSMTIGTNLSCPSWKKISETFRCLVREFLMLPFQCRPQGTLLISYISHFPDNLALHTFVMTLIHIFISVI